MRRTLIMMGFIVLSVCVVNFAHAQKNQNLRPWWVGAEFGDGQLSVASDQAQRSRRATFALGFVGGHRLGSRARIGLDMNGWLLQPFDLYDPTVGESVSNVLPVVDVFPIRRSPLFLRLGAGLAFYQNNRPNGFNGTGGRGQPEWGMSSG